MLALLIISFVVFNTYVGYIAIRYGILSSISESWKVLPKKQKFMFTAATWAYAFPLIPAGVAHIGLSFFAGLAIMFVGAAPAYEGSGLEASVHKYGAIFGVLLSIGVIVGIMILFPAHIATYIIILSAIALLFALIATVPWFKQNWLLWVEVVVYYGAWASMLGLYFIITK